MKLLVATSNPHKLSELRNMLGDKFQLVSLDDIGWKDEIEETAETMEGNAVIKALTVAKATEMNCIADDSGLEIDALEGRPGVYSARYAGLPGDDRRNLQKVLEELREIQDRDARFRSVIALVIDGALYCFEGTVEGKINTEERGDRGFGYDPIFVPAGDKRTFAEMPPEEKDSMSHRARASQKLNTFLNEYLKCKNRVSPANQTRG